MVSDIGRPLEVAAFPRPQTFKGRKVFAASVHSGHGTRQRRGLFYIPRRQSINAVAKRRGAAGPALRFSPPLRGGRLSFFFTGVITPSPFPTFPLSAGPRTGTPRRDPRKRGPRDRSADPGSTLHRPLSDMIVVK